MPAMLCRLSAADLAPAAAEKEKALYTVLEQQAAQVGAAGIMGSDHTYVIPGGEEPRRAGAAARKRCAASPDHGSACRVLGHTRLHHLNCQLITVLVRDTVKNPRSTTMSALHEH